jgi:hypothetical protein
MSFNPRHRWTAWLRWPDPGVGPWHVGLTWSGTQKGRAELVGFELWSRPPGNERLTPGPEAEFWDEFNVGLPEPPKFGAKVLHDLPLISLVKDTRRQLIETFEAEAARRRDAGEKPLDGFAEGLATTRQGRYGPEHFAAVADVYTEALAQGLDPYSEIRERLPASKSTIAKWVSRARHDFGLLPPTTRGRPASFGPSNEQPQHPSPTRGKGM